MRLGWFQRLFLAVVMAITGVAAAGAEERVALVVGNSAYRHITQLPNPRND
ncbi:caspase family protein, partial [Salmonella enterica subsp. enterica]|nr:caspase family protein [Salmonella enterica subsp. enterica serovar Enteritidis]